VTRSQRRQPERLPCRRQSRGRPRGGARRGAGGVRATSRPGDKDGGGLGGGRRRLCPRQLPLGSEETEGRVDEAKKRRAAEGGEFGEAAGQRGKGFGLEIFGGQVGKKGRRL
jgi:hypothetical protein